MLSICITDYLFSLSINISQQTVFIDLDYSKDLWIIYSITSSWINKLIWLFNVSQQQLESKRIALKIQLFNSVLHLQMFEKIYSELSELKVSVDLQSEVLAKVAMIIYIQQFSTSPFKWLMCTIDLHKNGNLPNRQLYLQKSKVELLPKKWRLNNYIWEWLIKVREINKVILEHHCQRNPHCQNMHIFLNPGTTISKRCKTSRLWQDATNKWKKILEKTKRLLLLNFLGHIKSQKDLLQAQLLSRDDSNTGGTD